jgi:hypothetical protein
VVKSANPTGDDILDATRFSDSAVMLGYAAAMDASPARLSLGGSTSREAFARQPRTVSARSLHVLAVAVQVAFEAKSLKPVYHVIIGSRVGSPGACKLWVNWIQRVQPHLAARAASRGPSCSRMRSCTSRGSMSHRSCCGGGASDAASTSGDASSSSPPARSAPCLVA